MGTVTIPNTFSNNQVPGPTPFNANFTALETAHNSLNTSVTTNTTNIAANTAAMAKIGSKAFYARTGTNTTATDPVTNQILTIDAETTDDGSVFSTASYKYIPAQTGTYMLSLTVRITSIGGTNATFQITKNVAGASETSYTIATLDSAYDGTLFSTTMFLDSASAADEFYPTVTTNGGDVVVNSVAFSGCCVRPD